MSSFDGVPIQMTGGRVDVYPLSERWMRGGAHVNGGGGAASIVGNDVSLNYGLLGLSAGAQYPARVTPFIEGHLSGGVLTGRLDAAVTTPGGTFGNTSATTWLYARGISGGAEFYTFGRLYVSASVGWIRTTWASPDVAATIQAPEATPRLTEITSDSLIWKLGLGL